MKTFRILTTGAVLGLATWGLTNCCLWQSDYTPEKPASLIHRLPAETRFALMTDVKANRLDFINRMAAVDPDARAELLAACEKFESTAMDLIDTQWMRDFIGELKNSQYYVVGIPMDKPVRYVNAEARKKVEQSNASILKALNDDKANANAEIEDDGLFDTPIAPVAELDEINWKLAITFAIKMPGPQYPESVIEELKQQKSTRGPKILEKTPPCGVKWYQVLDKSAGVITTDKEVIVEHNGDVPFGIGICAYGDWLIVANNTVEPFIKTLATVPEKSLADLGYGVPDNSAFFFAGNFAAVREDIEAYAAELSKKGADADAAGDMSRSKDIFIGKAATETMNLLKNVFEIDKIAGYNAYTRTGTNEMTGALFFTEEPNAGLKALLTNDIPLTPPDFIGIDSANIVMQSIDVPALYKLIIANLPAEAAQAYNKVAEIGVKGYQVEELVGLIRGDIYMYSIMPEFDKLLPLMNEEEINAQPMPDDVMNILYAIGTTDPDKAKKVFETLGKLTFAEVEGTWVSDYVAIRGDKIYFGMGNLFRHIAVLPDVPESQRISTAMKPYGKVNCFSTGSSRQIVGSYDFFGKLIEQPKFKAEIEKGINKATGKGKILADAAYEFARTALPAFNTILSKYLPAEGPYGVMVGKLDGKIYRLDTIIYKNKE